MVTADPKRQMTAPGLTVAEAARRLHRCEATVWRWIATGRLRAVHVGSRRGGLTYVPVTALASVRVPERGRPFIRKSLAIKG